MSSSNCWSNTDTRRSRWDKTLGQPDGDSSSSSRPNSYTNLLAAVTLSSMGRKPWLRVVESVLLAIAVTAGLIGLTIVAVKHDRWQHLGQHISIGAGFTVLLIASQLAWPAPRQGVERWLRRGLVLGFSFILIGSALEAVGAFGFGLDNGDVTTDRTLSGAHNIGTFFGSLGMLAILVGLIGTTVVRLWFRIRRQPSTI